MIRVLPRDLPPHANALRSDRPLYLAGNGTRVVEQSDPDSEFLLVPAGGWIEPEDVERFALATGTDGRIVLRRKMVAPAPNKMRRRVADKSAVGRRTVADDPAG
jgi:hypothetical protein